MSVRFATLASGSRGNVARVRVGGVDLLIDLGLGPRSLADRLERVGGAWESIRLALLTHTHRDHARDPTLGWLARQGVGLCCHEEHRAALATGPGYQALESAGLVRWFDDRPFLAAPGVWVEPIELRHGGPTFGFRIEARAARKGRPVSLGYLSDTGSWNDTIADALTDVDLLALEFNHDVQLQRASSRAPSLIARNLGDWGHLSNDQGADLLSNVLARSRRGSIRDLVLLHLSAECNRAELALQAARGAFRQAGRRGTIQAARQDEPLAEVWVRPGRRQSPKAAAPEPSGFPWEA